MDEVECQVIACSRLGGHDVLWPSGWQVCSGHSVILSCLSNLQPGKFSEQCASSAIQVGLGVYGHCQLCIHHLKFHILVITRHPGLWLTWRRHSVVSWTGMRTSSTTRHMGGMSQGSCQFEKFVMMRQKRCKLHQVITLPFPW